MVAPCVGAWIETVLYSLLLFLLPVAPCVGAWIETDVISQINENASRTLRGCVD